MIAIVIRKPVAVLGVLIPALIVGCSSLGDEGTIPADPLGVQERLADTEETIVWQLCAVTEFGGEVEGSDRRRSAGVFSVSGMDAISSHQLASQAAGPIETYATDGGEVVRYSDHFGLTARWGETGSLWEVVVSAVDLVEPERAIEALGVSEVSPVTRTDEDGRRYLHYESLPAATWDLPGSDEVWPAATLLGYQRSTVVYAVDIWADDAGRTERVRLRTQDLRRHWAELRFTDQALTSRGAPELPDCPDGIDETLDGWVGFEEWDQQLTVPLQVALDPHGRPYDVVPAQGATIRSEQFGTIYTPDGTVVVMDGGALQVDMVAFFDEGAVVDFGRPTDLDVLVIWEVFDDWEQPLGVRLDRPGTTVDRWESWELGYMTDGGSGGFTTGSVLAEARRRADASLSEDFASILVGEFRDITMADLDGVDGFDTMHFFNGWGDGAFPMARGVDAQGDTVSLYIFDLRYPWRLAIPDGAPPPNVTAREREYIECLDGAREVRPDGQCPADEDPF